MLLVCQCFSDDLLDDLSLWEIVSSALSDLRARIVGVMKHKV